LSRQQYATADPHAADNLYVKTVITFTQSVYLACEAKAERNNMLFYYIPELSKCQHISITMIVRRL